MKKISLLALSLLTVGASKAQSGLMSYGSLATTAAQQANPAMTGDARFVLGGSFGAEMKNSFILGDNFVTINGGKYLDLKKFASTLDTKNTLDLSLGADLFHLGFKHKKNFWSIGSQFFDYTNLSFSKDLVKLAGEGNTNNPVLTLNQEGFNTLSFSAIYLGFARTMLDGKLKIGIRAKQLYGLALLQTDRFNINVTTNPNSNPAYALVLRSDVQLQAAGIAGISVDSTLRKQYPSSKYQSEASNFGKGFGFDLGAEFRLNSKLSLSASAINLGGNINWNAAFSRQLNIGGTGQFEFSGVIRDLSNESTTSTKTEFDSIRASAERQYDVKTTNTSGVSSQVPTVIFAALTYQLTEKQSITALYRNHTYANQSHNLLGVKYQIAPWRWLQIMAGATLPSNAPIAFGGGVVWSPGPLQLFVMADNISGASAFDQTKHMQIQAGLSIRLKERKAKLTPAAEPEKK